MPGVVIIIIIVILILLVIYLQYLGAIPRRYPLTSFDDKEILLEKRKGVCKQLTWENIKAILPLGFTAKDMSCFHNFCFESKSGDAIAFCIPSKNVAHVLTELHDKFSESLKKVDHNAENYNFAHPKIWIESKKKHFNLHLILSTTAIIMIILIGIINFRGLGQYLFPMPFIAIFTVIVTKEWLVIYHRACVISLKINENKLIWNDDFGKAHSQKLTDVKNCYIGKIKAHLEFIDGTKLLDMEKLSYWPLLREYLLQKLDMAKTEI